MMQVNVRDARQEDATAIATIYNAHVRDSVATFELEPVAMTAMQARIGEVQGAGLPWLVIESVHAVTTPAVVGYAYATPWKTRAAYARTVETSIYLAHAARGRGLGWALYAALIERLRLFGMHALIGGISLPNAASVALHESLGFLPAGRFREVGFKHGRWVDVGYWQRLLAETAKDD